MRQVKVISMILLIFSASQTYADSSKRNTCQNRTVYSACVQDCYSRYTCENGNLILSEWPDGAICKQCPNERSNSWLIRPKNKISCEQIKPVMFVGDCEVNYVCEDGYWVISKERRCLRSIGDSKMHGADPSPPQNKSSK